VFRARLLSTPAFHQHLHHARRGQSVVLRVSGIDPVEGAGVEHPHPRGRYALSSAVVDATNYVMLETGQPSTLDMVRSRRHRRPRPPKMTMLDGHTRSLGEEMPAIWRTRAWTRRG